MKMMLNGSLDAVTLIQMIRECQDDVRMQTPEGDDLNLKSALSQYIFTMLSIENESMDGCWLLCSDTDGQRLSEKMKAADLSAF